MVKKCLAIFLWFCMSGAALALIAINADEQVPDRIQFFQKGKVAAQSDEGYYGYFSKGVTIDGEKQPAGWYWIDPQPKAAVKKPISGLPKARMKPEQLGDGTRFVPQGREGYKQTTTEVKTEMVTFGVIEKWNRSGFWEIIGDGERNAGSKVRTVEREAFGEGASSPKERELYDWNEYLANDDLR